MRWEELEDRWFLAGRNMAKRLADKELNRDNWADEEEPEERGQFKTADKEELGRRVIKTARRSTSNSASSSPFAAFAFGSTQDVKPTSSTTLVNGSATTAPPSKETPKTGSVFLSKLTSLNKCFVNWLEKHLNSNPCCDFTPVFHDYKRHLDEIRSRYASKPEHTESVTTPLAMNFKPSATGNFTPFQISKVDANSVTPSSHSSKSEVGSHGVSEAKTFSFGISTSSDTTPAFAFSAKPSFGFSAIAPASTQKDSNGSDEEEYVPPKEEITPVEETDAVYTKRCKLFQKKDNSYADRGVGILYIKPQNDKHQLLIRADTRLGNILLNIMLAPTLPVSRLGKNNVALVCIPNSPVNSEGNSASPTTMLLRVRTAEDADELKSALDRYKGQADS